jgi:DNA (cytosine-5)-methyltransferase 1
MNHYYNEFDPKSAAWLRELIKAGAIPAGEVDERSITDVKAYELKGFIQCHFFAGIGGWPYALKLSGWPADRPVWTGSCPCQPFSAAGKGLGEEDERHLWPTFAHLIETGKPPVVFGEQVASKLGRAWLSGVFADLERMGYQRAGADLCVASVGAPHIRQRLYWMGNAEQPRLEGLTGHEHEGDQSGRNREEQAGSTSQAGGFSRLGNAEHNGSHRTGWGEAKPNKHGKNGRIYGGANSWSKFDILHCLDGKARRIESGTFPLAHGVSGRVGLLRGYGNAIVPQVAEQFIRAFVEIEKERNDIR